MPTMLNMLAGTAGIFYCMQTLMNNIAPFLTGLSPTPCDSLPSQISFAPPSFLHIRISMGVHKLLKIIQKC